MELETSAWDDVLQEDKKYTDWGLLKNDPAGWMELERTLLSLVLQLEQFSVLAPLHPNDFYVEKYRNAMSWVLGRASIPTTADVLLHGDETITELLLNPEPTIPLPVERVPELVTVIREFARRRAYSRLLEDAARFGRNGEVAKARAAMSEAIALENPITQDQNNGLCHAVTRRLLSLQDSSRPKLHFGFPVLDRVVGTLSDGGLFMIGARTSTGKTTLALSLASRLAATNVTSAVISLEDDERKLADRIIATALGCTVDEAQARVASGNYPRELVEHATNLSSRILLYTPRTNTLENVLAAITQAGKMGARVVFLDYIHEVQVPTDMVAAHDWPVATATKSVKELCRHLNITAVVFAQMTKPQGGQEFVRPELREIRDSQKLADVAEWAMVLWRSSKNSDARVFGRIEKNKNGRSGVTLEFKHTASRVMFGDIVSANDIDTEPARERMQWNPSWAGKM